jgi:hypothetical protein
MSDFVVSQFEPEIEIEEIFGSLSAKSKFARSKTLGEAIGVFDKYIDNDPISEVVFKGKDGKFYSAALVLSLGQIDASAFPDLIK